MPKLTRLIALLILSTSTISCATAVSPVFVYGVDGADMKDGCPKDPENKMWLTHEWARKFYHLNNQKR